MKLHFSISILLLIFGCSFFVSCQPETRCYQEMNSVMVVTLSADSINNNGDTINYTQWDSIAIIGIGSDISMQGKKLKSIGVELRPDTNITMYLMQYHNQTDTLFVEHTPKQHFVSMACGCAVYHTINKVWSSDSRIENIAIINANIETIAQDNICIHLHE